MIKLSFNFAVLFPFFWLSLFSIRRNSKVTRKTIPKKPERERERERSSAPPAHHELCFNSDFFFFFFLFLSAVWFGHWGIRAGVCVWYYTGISADQPGWMNESLNFYKSSFFFFSVAIWNVLTVHAFLPIRRVSAQPELQSQVLCDGSQ